MTKFNHFYHYTHHLCNGAKLHVLPHTKKNKMIMYKLTLVSIAAINTKYQ